MQILLVEKEKSTIKFLTKRVQELLGIRIVPISCLRDLKDRIFFYDDKSLVLLNKEQNPSFLNFLKEENIPTIITNTLHNKKQITNPESLTYVVSQIDRLYKNQHTKVLIVDNIKSDRATLKKILKSQFFEILTASNPLKALQIMEKNPDIKIVITDFKMPLLNGIEFLKIIRRNYSKNHLGVIGISHDNSISSIFLQHGANDFITKPFNKDELKCRINNSAEALENIAKLQEIANLDFLTKISNRKHFFEKVDNLLLNDNRKNISCALAMIDIDNFKSINDTYGHDIGDKVIKSLANLLSNNIKGHDIVARFGGEEFVLYLKDIKKEDSMMLLDEICKKISNHNIDIDKDNTINITVSIGLVTQLQKDVSSMITDADKLLYHAKRAGKNRVVSDFVLVQGIRL